MFNQEFMKERKKGLKVEGFRAEVVCFWYREMLEGCELRAFLVGFLSDED